MSQQKMRGLRRKNPKPKRAARRAPEWVRRTISLPEEVMTHLERMAAAPQHAGNASSVIRFLVLRDAQALVPPAK